MTARTLHNRRSMRRILSSIVFTVALLCPWIASAQTPPTSCNTTSQNLWVRDQLTTYYYWYQFMPSGVNPATFNSPEAYLEAVRYRPIDNYYSYIQSAEIGRASCRERPSTAGVAVC